VSDTPRLTAEKRWLLAGEANAGKTGRCGIVETRGGRPCLLNTAGPINRLAEPSQDPNMLNVTDHHSLYSTCGTDWWCGGSTSVLKLKTDCEEGKKCADDLDRCCS
jgi:hypothetical protein